jgi:hypothetical protein
MALSAIDPGSKNKRASEMGIFYFGTERAPKPPARAKKSDIRRRSLASLAKAVKSV